MMGSRSLIRVSYAVTVLTFTGAMWSGWTAAGARAPLAALEVRVAALQHEADQLTRLPDLPPLPPLQNTLGGFLSVLPPGLTVKFALTPDAAKRPFAGIPNLPGVRAVVLEVSDAHPAVELPQLSLATVAEWQARWPMGVRRAVWNGRSLVTTLMFYGR